MILERIHVFDRIYLTDENKPVFGGSAFEHRRLNYCSFGNFLENEFWTPFYQFCTWLSLVLWPHRPAL